MAVNTDIKAGVSLNKKVPLSAIILAIVILFGLALGGGYLIRQKSKAEFEQKALENPTLAAIIVQSKYSNGQSTTQTFVPQDTVNPPRAWRPDFHSRRPGFHSTDRIARLDAPWENDPEFEGYDTDGDPFFWDIAESQYYFYSKQDDDYYYYDVNELDAYLLNRTHK